VNRSVATANWGCVNNEADGRLPRPVPRIVQLPPSLPIPAERYARAKMVALGLLVLLGAVSSDAGPLRVPVIYTGWDSPDTRQFRKGLAAFEKWGVFDGTTLTAFRTLPGGERKPALFAFRNEKWAWGDFAPALEDLKAAKPTACRENYLLLLSNPGDVDWFDDAGWASVVEHWRLLGRLAKRGGLRGILFDPEPYSPPHSQFLYRAQPQREAHTFAEYRAQARKRGREVMQAVRAEFPDATIFAYRLFSDMLSLPPGQAFVDFLEPHAYGLLPAFVDGWLDAMPAGMRVIEGTESIGYHANSEAEYQSAYARLKLRMPDILAPEHREKVRRQFLVGQSLYLDAYINPPGSSWYIDRTGTTSAGRLSANLSSALASSDGVVWVYGEKARWWDAGDPAYPMWPKALPGAIEAIRRAKDPTGYARDFWARSPSAPNLLPNADFSKVGADGTPNGWFQWQDGDSHGKVVTSGGEVELRGMLDGVVGAVIEVKPKSCYALRVNVRSDGRGLASLNVGWKNKAGAWIANAHSWQFGTSGKPDGRGYREIVAWVEVPAEAAQLVFMPAATAQLSEADRCRFAAPSLVEIVDAG
jgi:hypothetical protein